MIDSHEKKSCKRQTNAIILLWSNRRLKVACIIENIELIDLLNNIKYQLWNGGEEKVNNFARSKLVPRKYHSFSIFLIKSISQV